MQNPTVTTPNANAPNTAGTAGTSAVLRLPTAYSLGMVATTLDSFNGKEVIRYLEKLEARAKLDNWTEEETLQLFKFKLVGEAYNFFKSDVGLDSLAYSELKLKFVKKFTPIKLPGENQWNVSKCFQRSDEDVSSFCTRLRILGAKLLTEDLHGATPDEEAGVKKKNRELLLNQFKVGLRKDLMKETGIMLLREDKLDLEKAEELVKLQEMTTMMLQGRAGNMRVSAVETERTCGGCGKMGHGKEDCWKLQPHPGNFNSGEERRCYTCGRHGHFARECYGRKPQNRGHNVCFSCQGEGHWAQDCPRNRQRGNGGYQTRGRSSGRAGFQQNWDRRDGERREWRPSTGAVPKRRQEGRPGPQGPPRNDRNQENLN